MKPSQIAITATGGMSYLLLRVADKGATMTDEMREELELFVEDLHETLEAGNLEDEIRDVIAETLNIGDTYFESDRGTQDEIRARVRAGIQKTVIDLTGDDATRVPDFYASLMWKD